MELVYLTFIWCCRSFWALSSYPRCRDTAYATDVRSECHIWHYPGRRFPCCWSKFTGNGDLAGGAAVTFATINVVGGYMVTDRMLGMFKSKRG